MQRAMTAIANKIVERASGAYPSGLPANAIGTGLGFQIDEQLRIKSLAGPVRGQPPTIYKPTGTSVRLIGFERHPVVQACMRVITDICSSVPFEVYKKIGDEKVLLPTHECQKLLDNPAFGYTARQLRQSFALNFIGYGNAFWRLIRVNGDPYGKIVQIRSVNPEGIQVVYVDSDMNVIAWLWVDHFGTVHTTQSSDIVHFRDLQMPPPYQPDVFGFPRAATALNSIAGDNEATKYVRQVVTNDGTPTLVFVMDAAVGQEDAETAQERWQQLNVERGRRGRAAFVGGVKDVKPIGFTLPDLEFPDLRRVNREDICAAFGVDPRMIGIASATKDAGLSGAQYVEARARLIQHTVEPILTVGEDTLSAWLAPEYGDIHIRYDRSVLQDLVEDDTATSNRVRGEFKDGLRTLEESREAIHLSPTPKPTDALFVPSGGMLVPAAVAVIDPTDPVEPPPSEPATPAAAAEPAAAVPVKEDRAQPVAVRKITNSVKERILTRGIKLSSAQRQLLWAAFDERATREEGEYKRTALRLFADEKGSVTKIFATQAAQAATHRSAESDDQYIQAALRKIKAGYKPGGEYHQRWLDSYRGLISRTFMVAGNDMASSAGVNFNLDSPAFHAAIQARNEKLGTYVTDTTARQITAAVAAGRKAGMGIGDIASLVDKAVFGGMTRSRAVTIARTESAGAMNQGEYDVAKDQGVMRSKEWLTQQDDRVRETHADIDGTRIDIDDEFDIGVSYPGDQSGEADEVINCRCTLLYYDEPA